MSATACTACECVWCCVCVWWSLCGMLLSINGPDCNAMCSLCVCVLVHVCVRVCGFSMNLYFIKISSASFNEWLFPLCAVELLKFLGFTVASFAWCARHALLGYVSLLVPKLQRENGKKSATKQWERSLLSTLCCCCICIWIPTAAAVFCNFCDFLAFIFGGPRKALGNIQARRLHPEHTAHKTHNTFILALTFK